MREFEIIRRLQNKLTESLSEEPGSTLDDGFSIPTTLIGKELVGSVDTTVEGRHFLRALSTPEQVGYKAFCAAFSDLAAMGATPRYAMINLQCSADESIEYLERIYVGINEFCREFSVKVLGGNLSRAAELSLAVTALGGLVGGQLPKLRSVAKAGEDLWVSGQIGLSHLGLLHLLEGRELPLEVREQAVARYQRPIPRFLAPEILERISACLDVSDGVLQDASHISERSGVAVVFMLSQLLFNGVSQELALEALIGGGDYELLFTAPVNSRRFLTEKGFKLVGRIEQGLGVSVTEIDGSVISVAEFAANAGFQHLGCDHFDELTG